jgi:TFIIF-interacting CTD phosphatase-like protein
MTASHKSYAEQMHQFLDPKKEILCAVFSKDHCVNYSKGRSVKNLLTFDYPLERLVLVDNFISAFALNTENGIPILPYYEGTSDEELKKLASFVKTRLLGAPDVRPVLKETFWVDLFHQITEVRQLVAKLQEEFLVQPSS